MNNLDLRSKALNNIPEKKLKEFIHRINESTPDIKEKNIKIIAVNRYAESNIPIDYWTKIMGRDWAGDNNLLNYYNEYIKDIRQSFIDGKSVCLASSHGRGKSLALSCILKKASSAGYTALYTTLSDIVAIMTQATNEEKFVAKRELCLVDFLFIDEVDNRFFSQSELSSELFARSFELIIRTRLQNKLPVLLATNSPNVKQSFSSFFKESLDSIMNNIPILPVSGTDFRKK